MSKGYELLVEKEAMWAKMLMEVLQDNGVPCASLPVFGAGFVLKTGVQERLQVYVPQECMEQARDLLDELFAGDNLVEGETP